MAIPLMVTIDPERDSIATIRAPLTAHQAVFRGGSGGLFREPHGQPVHAHVSHANVLGGAGALRTVVPPILSAERRAEIAASYFD